MQTGSRAPNVSSSRWGLAEKSQHCLCEYCEWRCGQQRSVDLSWICIFLCLLRPKLSLRASGDWRRLWGVGLTQLKLLLICLVKYKITEHFFLNDYVVPHRRRSGFTLNDNLCSIKAQWLLGHIYITLYLKVLSSS